MLAGPTVELSRRSEPPLDLLEEASIAAAAAAVAARGLDLRLVIDATGFLHGAGFAPERSLRQIDPVHMARSFAINAIGPALLMRFFLPLLPKQGRSVFATLSARVGSIGDNSLGGWYSYRSSKAALNQLVRTASIELRRSHPEAICVAIHPGTVATGLSAPFAKAGLELQTADQAAAASCRFSTIYERNRRAASWTIAATRYLGRAEKRLRLGTAEGASAFPP